MKIPEEVRTMCDECGRSVKQIWRIHAGKKFCAACYKRVFETRTCPECGKPSRLHKKELSAVCRSCEKNRPCIRCGKETYLIGKITPNGPVCDSCAVHYREPKPCERCGTLSKRLSKYLKYGIMERICPRCANVLRGNCSMCGKNRYLVTSAEGKQGCKKCNEEGYIQCPECGSQYPAGYGKKCRGCYYRDLLDRKLALDLGGFETSKMQFIFQKYADWLLRTIGAEKASITINKHFNFFQFMEQRWQCVPDYSTLLAFYGAEGLRRHRLPMRYFDETGVVHVNEIEKKTDSEMRRIAVIVEEFQGPHEIRLVLMHYRGLLMESVDKSNLKITTVRLYLQAAAGFLKAAKSWPATQGDLNRYLKHVPGQRASLTKFTSCMKTHWETEIFIPDRKSTKRGAGDPVAEKKLVRLIKEAGENASYTDRKILAASMAYYHGISEKALHTFEDFQRQVGKSEGYVVFLGGREYWLPPILSVSR